MAWSWSHTREAYRNAEDNLRNLGADELKVIETEWSASTEGEYGGFDLDIEKYDKLLPLAGGDPDAIWKRASELATCDNGGSNAWVCPFGCHTVPFDAPDDEEA